MHTTRLRREKENARGGVLPEAEECCVSPREVPTCCLRPKGDADNLQSAQARFLKLRCASHRRLDQAAARAGVVCHSSGNHGQAVAAAAAVLGTTATVQISTIYNLPQWPSLLSYRFLLQIAFFTTGACTNLPSFRCVGAQCFPHSSFDNTALSARCYPAPHIPTAAFSRAAASTACPQVVVPNDTPAVKVAAIEGYGARVVLCEPTQQSRAATAAGLVAETGGTMIPPYNHPAVMAGQGTIGLELVEQCPGGLEAIVVPTSGGGMIAGIATAAAALLPGCRVFAAEPAGKRLAQALATGTRVVDPGTADQMLDTVADAIRTQPIGELAWPVVQAHVDPVVFTVTDPEILGAMRFATERLKLVIEPAAATGLAAVLSGQVATELLGSPNSTIGTHVQRAPVTPRVAVVLCGGKFFKCGIALLLPFVSWNDQMIFPGLVVPSGVYTHILA